MSMLQADAAKSLRPFFHLLMVPFLLVTAANLAWFVGSAFVEANQRQADIPIVYKGARIHTASGPVIERGVMIVLKGKILDVGAEDKVKIPDGAKIHDMTGEV